MKIVPWGIQSAPAPDKIETGSLVAGECAETPWLGLVVEDGDGQAIVLLSDFHGPAPSVVDLDEVSGAMHVITGIIAIEPIDPTRAFRLPRGVKGRPGGLIIGRSGGFGVIATYVQGPGRQIPLLYNLETGKRWVASRSDQVVSGWRLVYAVEGRPERFELARFDVQPEQTAGLVTGP